MNCVIYVRVSTEQQAERELSIPAQLKATRDHAARQEWVVIEEFAEPGASARTTNRPVLQQVLSRCRQANPKIDVVLVHKIDRLARNIADHVAIRTLLQQHGVTLASVVENIDDSITGQLVENIMASIAQFYSANLGEETKKGMRQLVEQGGWPHKPPLGYRTERGADGRSKVVLDEQNSAPIRAAFEDYSTGFVSLNDVRWQLFKLGVRTGRGRPLPLEMTRRMLMNPFYVSRLRWSGAEYAGKHEALVSSEVFARVQRVLSLRHRDSGEKGRLHFALRGVAFCAECGGKMTAERHPRGSYYRCIRKHPGACTAPYSNVTPSEKDMTALCRKLRLSAALRAKLLTEGGRLIHAQINGAKRRLKSLQMQRTKLTDREAKLTETFASGDLTLRTYRTVMSTLRARIEGVERTITEGEANPAALLQKLEGLLDASASLWDIHGRVEERRRSQLLRLVFKRVLLEKGAIVGYVLREPFDRLLDETPPLGRNRGPGPLRPPFKDVQVTAAINSIFEQDLEPLLRLSQDTAAAA